MHRPLEGHNSSPIMTAPISGVVGDGAEIGAGSPGEGSGPDFIARTRLFVNQTKLWLTVESSLSKVALRCSEDVATAPLACAAVQHGPPVYVTKRGEGPSRQQSPTVPICLKRSARFLSTCGSRPRSQPASIFLSSFSLITCRFGVARARICLGNKLDLDSSTASAKAAP
jgi:hypothetical protein